MFSSTVSPAASLPAAVPAAGLAPVLEVCGLRAAINQRFAIADVNFTLGRGETIAIIGRNGSGKSSLLRLLSGLASPDAGTVRIAGHASTDWNKTARHLGLVQQSKEMPAHTTVGEYVLQQIDLRRARRDSAPRLLAMAGLSDFLKHDVAALSGGNRRKLHILCALAHGPDLLLADEPCAGLDAQFQSEVIDYLNELKQQLGMSMVIATHQLEEVEALADLVGVMAGGRLLRLERCKREHRADGPASDTLALDFADRTLVAQQWTRLASLLHALPYVVDATREGERVALRCRSGDAALLARTVGALAEHEIHLRNIKWAEPGMKELIQGRGMGDRWQQAVRSE
ncbi:ATP-binding cassette domain-containing protein [Massilia sp. CCM 8694]|uniref:ATP-binding cassette domain-containing protein n=1 Tax=Massilia genomosp. 1 TaxID=2609280 RepID=A0ABX0MMY8_9BURK|nr:ABC transporter ATP-binding protein [Massilia genomosp. 1]NHZ64140.1 ATP-binding cassette domain-containing protein [Massilia genomosp. 1]